MMKRTFLSLLLVGAALLIASGPAAAAPREGGGTIPGSLLLFPYWDGTGSLRTMFRITNTGPNFPIDAPSFATTSLPVHLIFVTGEEYGCGEWDSVIRLTAGQAYQIDLGTLLSPWFRTKQGFALAYVGDAVDKFCWDYLLGDWWIVDTATGSIIGD